MAVDATMVDGHVSKSQSGKKRTDRPAEASARQKSTFAEAHLDKAAAPDMSAEAPLKVKKKRRQRAEDEAIRELLLAPAAELRNAEEAEAKSAHLEKKSKKRKAATAAEVPTQTPSAREPLPMKNDVPAAAKPNKSKKRKSTLDCAEASAAETEETTGRKGKKRKRKSAVAETFEDASVQDPVPATEELSAKRRKVSRLEATSVATPVFAPAAPASSLEAGLSVPSRESSAYDEDACIDLGLPDIFSPRLEDLFKQTAPSKSPSKSRTAPIASTSDTAAVPLTSLQLSSRRIELLQDWSFSVKEASVQAQRLGFTLKQGVFSKVEDDLIKQATVELCRRRGMDHDAFVALLTSRSAGGSHKDEDSAVLAEWREILLPKLPDRLLKSVQLHARKLFDPSRRTGPFTSDEDKQLLELHERYGADWARIGALMGRAGDVVKHHYRKASKLRTPDIGQGRWTAEEVDLLLKAYKGQAEASKGKLVSWVKIATAVGSRTDHQCRQYIELHPPERSSDDWTKDQKLAMLEAIRDQKPPTEKEIAWAVMLDDPELSDLSAFLLARQFKTLVSTYKKRREAKGKSVPTKLRKLVKALIGMVEEQPDSMSPKKRRVHRVKAAAEKASQQAFKSAEFVSDSEEDLPEAF